MKRSHLTIGNVLNFVDTLRLLSFFANARVVFFLAFFFIFIFWLLDQLSVRISPIVGTTHGLQRAPKYNCFFLTIKNRSRCCILECTNNRIDFLIHVYLHQKKLHVGSTKVKLEVSNNWNVFS